MMRHKKHILAVCTCMMLLGMLLSACSKRTDVKEGDSFIYCLNEDRTGLVKVTYQAEGREPLNAAKAILKELKQPTEDIEYTAPIPEDVEVTESELVGEVLYLNFNEKYREMPLLEEKLVRAAIVQSLVQMDGISAVWFRISGEDLTDSTGKLIGFQNGDDFVQNTGSALSSYQTGTLKLYFANEAGDKLVEQIMDVKYSSNTSKEKLIVEKLMKGPKKGAGRQTINPNASILGVTIKDGICYVNFDDEFLTSQMEVKPEVTIYSIVNSLVEGTPASKVQITINGEKNISYMETVDLTQPLQRDMNWVVETEGK